MNQNGFAIQQGGGGGVILFIVQPSLGEYLCTAYFKVKKI